MWTDDKCPRSALFALTSYVFMFYKSIMTVDTAVIFAQSTVLDINTSRQMWGTPQWSYIISGGLLLASVAGRCEILHLKISLTSNPNLWATVISFSYKTWNHKYRMKNLAFTKYLHSLLSRDLVWQKPEKILSLVFHCTTVNEKPK